MKTALIQYDIAWLDAAKNRDFLNETFKTLEPDTKLILLPEMFDTGFCTSPYAEMAGESKKTVEWLRIKAREMNVCIGGSIIVPEDGKFYNRLFWAMPDGTLNSYDKRHLFSIGNEHLSYTQGKERKVFEYHDIRFCPQICYDLRFPVFCRCRNDYDVLVFVANWPASRTDVWLKLIMARAIENQCYVLAVNRTGTDGNGIVHSGNSLIVDFKGNIVTEGLNDQNDVITAELDMEGLKDFRSKFPSWVDGDDFEIKL